MIEAERMTYEAWCLRNPMGTTREAWHYQEKAINLMSDNMANMICSGKENLRGTIEQLHKLSEALAAENNELREKLEELGHGR